MSYYTDDDYRPASPGLALFKPDLGYSLPPPYAPLWFSEDIPDTFVDNVHFERRGDGLETRQRLFDQYSQPESLKRLRQDDGAAELLDATLMHHMGITHKSEFIGKTSGSTHSIRTNAPPQKQAKDAMLAPSRPPHDYGKSRLHPIPQLEEKFEGRPSLPRLKDFMDHSEAFLRANGKLEVTPLPPSTSPRQSRSEPSGLSENLPALNPLEMIHAPKTTRLGNGRPEVISPATWPRQSPSGPPATNPLEMIRKPKTTRLGLPITVHTEDSLATVFACADTGADINVISHDLATTLGYTSYAQSSERKEFALANGKIVESLGQIESTCSFGVEMQASFTVTCMFHVLLNVATPIIMGMAFLEETQTMTEHRERLVRVPRPASQALFVRSIDKPRRMLTCKLGGREILSLPDSGSDIDLMSYTYAIHSGFEILPGNMMIELADGSFAITSGIVRSNLSIDPPPHLTPQSLSTNIPMVNFFILEGLIQDVIVSEDSIEELKIFQFNTHALVSAKDQLDSQHINGIRLLGSIDGVWSRIKNFFHNRRIGLVPLDSGTSSESYAEDQQENHRREREEVRIATLALHEQETALEAELQRRSEYDARVINLAHGSDAFRCEYPGCNAASFQTQYLLNSHTNIHSSSRPHYCPVADCPRALGGKGFKRQNEMIRHRLIHLSPGYVCPFCPDREHKYPRPDNLQRHVRVHHPDKNKDDPQLRDVLAQRHGGSRGRRRQPVPPPSSPAPP